jgi:Peptidase_C39 like family
MDTVLMAWAIAALLQQVPLPSLAAASPSCLAMGCLASRYVLQVPDMSQFQDTEVDCGPHAAARVLAGLGLGAGDRFYRQLQVARRTGLGQDALAVQLGTTPDFLARLIGEVTTGRAIAHVEREVEFRTLKSRLSGGYPVLALVRTGTVPTRWGGGFSLTVPGLHWIVVTGFDDDQRHIVFRDTQSNAVSTIAYADFLNGAADASAYTWTWTLGDRAVAEVLRQTGTTPNTLMWIEAVQP